jgi:hypothetical protein
LQAFFLEAFFYQKLLIFRKSFCKQNTQKIFPSRVGSTKMPLLGLNSGLQASILHRDFKIQGTIGEVGQKDKQ